MKVTDKGLAELVALTLGATPGPWYVCEDNVCRHECPAGNVNECPHECESGLIASPEDLDFIAVSREAVPSLISRICKLEAEKAWLAEQCVKFGDKTPRESAEYWLKAADRETRMT